MTHITSDRPQRSVTCVWCGNRYRSACPDSLDRGLQGSHCASDNEPAVETGMLHGVY